MPKSDLTTCILPQCTKRHEQRQKRSQRCSHFAHVIHVCARSSAHVKLLPPQPVTPGALWPGKDIHGKENIRKKNRCSLSYRAAPLPTRTSGVGTVGDACLDEFLVALLNGAKQLGRRFLLFKNDTTINPQRGYKRLQRNKQRFANRQGL